jgi:hypothetical protein
MQQRKTHPATLGGLLRRYLIGLDGSAELL